MTTAPAAIGAAARDAVHRPIGRLLERGTKAVGGPEQFRVVVVLAAVISLASADVGTIAALVPQLESDLHIGNTAIGLLVTATGLVSALATLPCGVLADRLPRLRLLAGAVVLWGVVELASAGAPTFGWLLAVRVLLGGVTAVAGPAIASLVGDFFSAAERGRIWGFILAGEVVGAGAGLLVADLISGFAGWRAALAVLCLPSIPLAYVLLRVLREPARGGTSRLQPTGSDGTDAAGSQTSSPRALARRQRAAARRQKLADVAAHRIPKKPPDRLSAFEAVRAVLRVPTNVLLIAAGSLGYFFLNGLRTFAVLFVRGQYGVSQQVATLFVLVVGVGILVGVFIGGRAADRFVERRLTARLTVAAAGFFVGATALVPGLFLTEIALAMPFYIVAGAAISEPNPPLDAARLDIIASGLWGRAESVRTAVRGVFESFAPLLFGLLSSVLAGSARPGLGAGVNASHGASSQAQTLALRDTFAIMTLALVAAGFLILRARRHYPTDVATADEYEARSAEKEAADVEDRPERDAVAQRTGSAAAR